jgi:hypothetical protein
MPVRFSLSYILGSPSLWQLATSPSSAFRQSLSVAARSSPSYAWQSNSVASGQIPAMPGSPILCHQDVSAIPGSSIMWHQDSLSYAWQSKSVASGQVPAMPDSPILWHQDKSQLCLAGQFCGISYVKQSKSMAARSSPSYT